MTATPIHDHRLGVRARTLLGAGPRLHWAIAAVVILALLSPMALTDRTFGTDWSNQLWLVWNQGITIHDLGHPSYFLQSTLGAFYPLFAFYGAPAFATAGLLSSVIGGHPVVAFVASYFAAAALGYGGLLWLARQLGVRGWRGHVPAVLFITSAYYVTNIYGRGAWTETMATSAIPLVLAAALSLLGGRRPTVRAAVALVAGVALFAGSHNLTLTWGAVFIVLLVGVAGIAGWAHRPPVRRLALVAGLALLGVGIDLWYLLPDLVFASKVRIGGATPTGAHDLDSFSNVFGLLRPERVRAHSRADVINVQTPVLGLAWAIAACALSWRALTGPWRRLAVGLLAIWALFTWLILVHAPFSVLPGFLRHIQFAFRLQTYVTLAISLLAIVGLRGVQRLRSRRGLVLSLAAAAIAALSLGQGLTQAWRQPSSLPSRHAIFVASYKTPPTWYATPPNGVLDYADASLPMLPKDRLGSVPGVTLTGLEGIQELSIPVTQRPQISGYAFRFPSPGPGPIATNVPAGDYIVGVHGARVAGRTDAGLLVVGTPPRPGTPTRITFQTARTWPIVVGKYASLLAGLIAVLALLAAVVFRARRRLPIERTAPGEGRAPAPPDTREDTPSGVASGRR